MSCSTNITLSFHRPINCLLENSSIHCCCCVLALCVRCTWGEDLEFEMIQSYNSIVSVSRTTISDIMSVSTTEKMEIMLPEASITKKTKLSATLPYNSAKMRPPVPQPKTDLSKYQTIELKLMKGEEFKEERRQFFRKLEFTRRQKQFLETNASVKIQAIVRGFLIRPRPERIRKIIYPPLKICCSTSNEARILQDELCAYAVHLGLKPITGLSLEARSKHKKRKNEIEYAASLRIQSFFRMIVAILRVRRAGQQARVRLHHQSAVKLQKFLRYVVWMVRRMKKQDESRELAALKIQSHYRRFKSFHRVRNLLKERKQRQRENDARIVINRSLMLAQKKRLKACAQN